MVLLHTYLQTQVIEKVTLRGVVQMSTDHTFHAWKI
jgi:D-hexose-6-phosphate mutarotase